MPDPIYRLIRLAEVLKILGISRSTFYAGIAKGIYPEGVLIGPNSRRWSLDEILALAKRGIR